MEIGLSPKDLLADKAIVSWTVGRQHYRSHLLLPRTVVPGPATLAYRLLPGGRATVHVAASSDLNDKGLPRGADWTNAKKYSMAQHTTVDDVLKFAIAQEEEAVQFYTRLAETMEAPGMRGAFLAFPAEEQKHKDTL